MRSPGIKVFAPASVANIAVGYDILGLALTEPGDEVIARTVDTPGVHIESISGDGGKLPTDPYKNTATYSAICLMKHLDLLSTVGVSFKIYKKMPFGSGLGSSAASAVAGVVACNEVLGRPLSRRELLPFAVAGEEIADGSRHADNVAPSLLGGITLIQASDSHDFLAHRLPVPKGLFVSVIYPHLSILTKDARDILLPTISLSDHITQSSNLSCFISALYTADFDLIRSSLQDVIIEPQRARLIPHFYDLKKLALDAGALGFSISGAGPTMFALSSSSLIAENVASHTVSFLNANNFAADAYFGSINQQGAIVY